MKEIGGYIELDKYKLPMLHEDAIALNCGRNCLGYLIKAKNIKRILLPCFICDSVTEVCNREQIEIRYYSIGNNFFPENVILEKNEWLYIVNYYGQLDNRCLVEFSQRYERIIVDNVQAYFQAPVEGIDTLYTCRKFFGVPDGAFLYTNARMTDEITQDESFHRMCHLLGRYERTAGEFYSQYIANEELLAKEPIKRMSKLTQNLLRNIDYEAIEKRRTENFTFLHNAFQKMNRLRLIIPQGAFMYPLYIENGTEVRGKLQKKHIYIPTLWPDVFKRCAEEATEFDMAKNILPLPVDQRYDQEDMRYLVEELMKCID